MLKIKEIIPSLQGEGKFTGFPTTFIRLHGCNLKCIYCDAQYANNGDYNEKSIDSIIKWTTVYGNKYVCITGGEPLIQEATHLLATKLEDLDFKVTIETNGSVPVKHPYFRGYSYCMDIKCPSSKMDSKNIYENLLVLDSKDEVKFVICTRTDYNFAKEVLQKYPTDAQVIFSPVFEADGKSHNGAEIAKWMQEDKLNNVRLGMQMHKLIGIY